jgi:hypothetical protein
MSGDSGYPGDSAYGSGDGHDATYSGAETGAGLGAAAAMGAGEAPGRALEGGLRSLLVHTCPEGLPPEHSLVADFVFGLRLLLL